MANQEPTLDALVTELAQLRATLAAQQDIIARQQAAISTLQQATSTEPARFAHVAERAPQSVTEDDQASDNDTSEQRSGLTSRRGLLRGAAAATAAATVAGVALSASQPAHAAPLTTGGNFILGQANDAGATTSLANTASTAPTATLQVSNDVVNQANAAIYTTTAGANGVYALESNGGNGVQGVGLTSLGYGVYGVSDAGWGVVGDSGTGADIASIGTGMILQRLQTNPGAPSSTLDIFSGGESIRDSNGDLWLCVAAGSPGTWVKVAHLAPGLPGGAISYLSKPIRLFDSRSGATDALFHPGVPCAANSSTKVQVSGDVYNGVTVPASVAGAIGNVTVLNAAGAGFVELVPSGAGFTGAANLAFAPGQIISNAFNVGLNSTGALDVYVGSSAVDVIVDLFAIVA